VTRAPVVALALVLGCAQSKAQTTHEGHAAPPDPHAAHAAPSAAAPSGYAPITIDERAAQSVAMTTATAVEQDFVKELRTQGIVVADETRTSHVHAKVRGWIDGISVAFVGKEVRAGQTLVSIYSQEVYAAELEFLAIVDRTQRPLPTVGEFAEGERRAQEQLISGARRRLSLWDVPRSEVERLERTREARRTFPLLAPRKGTVVAKQALDGMFVDPSVELYTISDLSRVWLLADVYEADVPFVKAGTDATIEVQGIAESIAAKVTFVPPTIDEATRTMKVRYELANPDGKLRPGSFATVRMRVSLGRSLAIPESAVIRTGARAIAFVVHGAHVEPREVELGPRVGDRFSVKRGLASGDVVATGAQFLLDSESRLRATGGGGGHAGH
jgi:Cu(I)/Ag(I) efflux system membrane fusion protein